MRIYVHVLSWGGQYCDFFANYALKAAMWPKNRAALEKYDAVFDVYSDKAGEKFLRDEIGKTGFDMRFTEVNTKDFKAVQSRSISLSMEHALSNKGAMLPLPPDLIFGDGSIGNLMEILDVGEGRALSAPHLRVNSDTFMAAFTGEPISNAGMVKMAFEHMHRGFADSEIPNESTCSFAGGVAWQKLSSGLRAAQFMLPTIHMIEPMQEDIDWFKANFPKCSWDLQFPSTLIENRRHRTVGSSDCAFAVELTHPKNNYPANQPTSRGHYDDYRYDMLHNKVNRNTVFIFREAE